MTDSASDIVRLSLLGVVALITIVAAGAFSKRLGVAAPLILIVIGVGFSFIPGAPVQIPHEVILLGLLPPILYSAAITVPVVDFKRNLRSITALSVVLVLVTAFVTGSILFLVFPALSYPAAIAIGAVISPTDAVAATALGKRMGLPPRLVTILEGEGLVNDATALVLLRSAVAATAASITFWDVVGDFLFAAMVAAAIGLAVGIVTVYVRSRLRDPILDTVISFAVPFIAFIPAEFVNASGVLAVVVAGLYSGHHSANRLSPQARISERLNWRTAQFVLENGVFLLMGIQVSYLIGATIADDLSADKAVWLGLLLAAILVVIRLMFVAPLLMLLRRAEARAERGHVRFGERLDDVVRRFGPSQSRDQRVDRSINRAQQLFSRRQADIDQLKREGLDWRGGAVLTWSGMRGVVTLAAAQSLPDSTPYREQLILIAFTVAVVTLLAQGGTLPWVIRRLGVVGTDRAADQQELASLLDEVGQAGVDVLANPESIIPGVTVDVVERARRDTLLHAEAAREGATHGLGAEGLALSPQRQYRILLREVFDAEMVALLEARASGRYPSRILNRAQALIDLELTRLAQIDDQQ
ncbi:MAG: cation:proton antiporter [Rhodoglobus sp.]